MSVASMQGVAHPMVLPVSIPKDADPAAVSSMVEALEKAFVVLVGTGQTSVLVRADRLAEFATGMLEPSVELVEDRVRRMKTVQQVFAEGDWIGAEQINALQAVPPANKSHPASDWKRRGRIFSVNYGGKEYFPRYLFDALYQPLPIIKDSRPRARARRPSVSSIASRRSTRLRSSSSRWRSPSACPG